jgi:pimeloyl-ACP methyl ester carboxylesterase
MFFAQKRVPGFLLLLSLTIGLVVGFAIFYTDAVVAKPLAQTTSTKPSIVLVHGAFADGSSWQRVIPLLERDGYTVTAVQNPLTSLSDDIATTKRVIDAQVGDVVVVGHSYGGSVITGAAAGNPHVKALVYLAAYAPDAGETIGALTGKFAPPPLITALVPDTADFLYVDRAKLHDVFAKDLSSAEASLLAVTQKPLAKATFDQSVNNVAWKTIPSWYLVSQEDRAINPDMERFMAKRIGAKTSEIKASHVAFLSHPQEVTQLIEAAATAPVKSK